MEEEEEEDMVSHEDAYAHDQKSAMRSSSSMCVRVSVFFFFYNFGMLV